MAVLDLPGWTTKGFSFPRDLLLTHACLGLVTLLSDLQAGDCLEGLGMEAYFIWDNGNP